MAAVAAAGVVGCSDDEGSAEELCAALRDEPQVTTTFTGFDPTDTPAALEQLRSARVTLGRLKDAAPSEVRDDLSVEIDYVQALIDALEPMNGRDAADVVATVQQVTDQHPEVADAAATLSAFAASACA